MKVIGLTGGIGAGKSTVAAHLAALGARVIDADAISRRATAPGGDAEAPIRQAFGDKFFPDGKLDRRALAALTFSDASARMRLEGIVHPIVFDRIAGEIEAARASGCRAVVVDMPLLFETGYERECDQVWLVTAGQETRLRRVAERDGVSRDAVERRIRAQMPDEEKRALATEVIDNSGALADALERAEQLWRRVNG